MTDKLLAAIDETGINLERIKEWCLRSDKDAVTAKIPYEEFSLIQAALDLAKTAVEQPDENGLLPCPFCGDKAAYGTIDGDHMVNCISCRANNALFAQGQSKETARDGWNTRPLSAAIEKLKQAVGESEC